MNIWVALTEDGPLWVIISRFRHARSNMAPLRRLPATGSGCGRGPETSDAATTIALARSLDKGSAAFDFPGDKRTERIATVLCMPGCPMLQGIDALLTSVMNVG